MAPRLSDMSISKNHVYLKNTYGIIVDSQHHNHIFIKPTHSEDNGYIWYSQVDGKEYYFYEDEVTGDIVK